MSAYVRVLARSRAETRGARQSHSAYAMEHTSYTFDPRSFFRRAKEDASDDENAPAVNDSDLDDDVKDKDYVQDAERSETDSSDSDIDEFLPLVTSRRVRQIEPTPSPRPLSDAPSPQPSTSRDTGSWLHAPSDLKRRRISSSVSPGASRSPSPSPTVVSATRRRSGRASRRRQGRRSTPSPVVRGTRPTRDPSSETEDAWVWEEDDDFQPNLFPFDESSSGIQHGMFDNESREADFVRFFWDDGIIGDIVSECNRFFGFTNAGRVIPPSSRDTRWTPLTIPEMLCFLCLTAMMGLIRKAETSEYWSLDPLLSTPIFGKVMSVNRFKAIRRFLHFVDNAKALVEQSQGKLQKIRIVYDDLRMKFADVFKPFKNVVIDESLMLWRGNIGFRQYIPSKRHRFGLKLFVMCDCKTGYILDFILYTGADTELSAETSPDLGLSGSIVATMMQPYLDKGHVLYTDNWYTSPSLCRFLQQHSTGFCGTVRKKRKHLPVFPSNMHKGDVVHRSCNDILCVNWHDKRDVNLLTTVHTPQMILSHSLDRTTRQRIEKPECVMDYNINMRLVDKSDAMIASVECARKTMKWYKKFFFHLVDMSLMNAHVLFGLATGKKVPLKDFILEACRQILEEYATEKPAARAPAASSSAYSGSRRLELGNHFPVYIQEELEGGKKRKQRRCVVCATSEVRPRKRKETTYLCELCQVPLCVAPCFKEYHSLEKY